jgi:hypothetical protein
MLSIFSHYSDSVVNEWVELGKKLWNARLITYGTKPLPTSLGIDDEKINEKVLDLASKKLNNEYSIPIRFQTFKQRNKDKNELMGKCYNFFENTKIIRLI